MNPHLTMKIDPTTPIPALPRIGPVLWVAIAAGVVTVALLIFHNLAAGGHAETAAEAHLPPAWYLGILPFVGILAAIAFMPLIPATHHWWESNLNRLVVSMTCAALTVLYAFIVGGLHQVGTVLEHAIVTEYIPFIVLLFSLYVISGGISLRGDLPAHPGTNTGFLAFGALIASFIGTTGASMLLIRPLLKTNSERKHVVHTVIFFIFLVSNIGGTLLPIGDPPLFLGYLYGVPFFWTFNLLPQWAVCCVILLIVYFVWDTLAYRRENKDDLRIDEARRQPLSISGFSNAFWMLGVVLSVAFISPGKEVPLLGFKAFPFLREILMLTFVGLSLKSTPAGVREYNRFNYAAILEVAALFIGIFVAMQIPLEVLRASGEVLPHYIHEPWHFFWATGSLSSFLDNAPTYVVFFELAITVPGSGMDMLTLETAAAGVVAVPLLAAVSLGAVFMGAMTYIGNGPNFMVKSIAEQSGIRMPSFFGYMFKYSIPILVPTFIVIMVLVLL
jgi:Na+/H+ antiporter NhaD/arsenite permease-like protein